MISTAKIEKNIEFFVERLEPSSINGWARYLNNDKPVQLELFVNQECIGSFRADIFRQDLQKIRPDGFFSFAISPFNGIEWQHLVPENAEIELREKERERPLLKTIWNGSAPKDQRGIVALDGQKMRINKGVLVVPLSSRTKEWRKVLVETASKLSNDAINSGFNVCASYGTLLGAVREGDLIEHDDDVDLMFISNKSGIFKAVEDFHLFQDYLNSAGYVVNELSNGQIHALAPNGFTVDIFLAWIQDENLSLTFTIWNGVHQSAIFPLKTGEINGTQLPIPQKPEQLLEAIYGPNWRTPDNAFEWRRPHDIADFFAPIHNYRRGANIEYWQDYYSRDKTSTPPQTPSQFALFTLSARFAPGLTIDLGCGNGRDTLFFASQGIKTIGLDYAASAISENQRIAEANNLSSIAQFKQLDITNIDQSKKAIDLILKIRDSSPLCIYSRFFFHALDEDAEGAALLFINQLLTKPGDYAALEFRTEQDANRTKVTPTHYRRYINPDQFLQKAETIYRLKCTYRTEGVGYAIFRDDDAHVARIILQKQDEQNLKNQTVYNKT